MGIYGWYFVRTLFVQCICEHARLCFEFRDKSQIDHELCEINQCKAHLGSDNLVLQFAINIRQWKNGRQCVRLLNQMEIRELSNQKWYKTFSESSTNTHLIFYYLNKLASALTIYCLHLLRYLMKRTFNDRCSRYICK